jgi:putative nucleotidyltransferase with HDIG domain
VPESRLDIDAGPPTGGVRPDRSRARAPLPPALVAPTRATVLRPLVRAFWVVAVASLGVVASVVGLALVQRNVRQWVDHSTTVNRIALEALELALDRETGVRGFLLTGDSASLRPEFAARRGLPPKLDLLATLTGDNPRQQALARAARDAVERWAREFADPALSALAQTGPRAREASPGVLAGKPQFDAVRDAFAVFVAGERALEERRLARERTVGILVLVAVAIDFAILGGVFAWLRRRVLQQASGLVRQHERLDAQAAALEASQLEVLERLATAAEFRDDDTGQHTRRVGEMAARLALAVGQSEADAALLRRAAPLHDVGKIAVPDAILLKPGRLTQEELAVMRTHAARGAEILAGGRSPLVTCAARIARSHHERWDGTGYPDGLAGQAIPIEARIVAVADFVDALSHDRVYRPAWPAAEVLAEVRRGRGTHFDPAIVDAYLAGVDGEARQVA